jgi:phosphoglycerate dehydrogenase-like enzyme
MTTRIAVLDDYQSAAAGAADWGLLVDADIDFVHEHLTGDALVDRIHDRDIVVAMRERTPFTRGLLARLPALKMLVTTGLIDQAALRQAIEGRWLRGVALDVYDIEPLPPDHWLRASDRTLLSPHMGYVSAASYRTFYGDVVENIAAYLAGAPIRVLPT